MSRAFCLIRAARAAYLHQHHACQPVPEIAAALALTKGEVRALAASLGLPLAGGPQRPRRPNGSFTMQQVSYLRRHYAEQPPAHFAELWGVAVSQVYRLAARHGIRRRAQNGRAEWRVPKAAAPAPWASGSRWAA